MKLTDFATDKNKEVNGVWFDLGDDTKVLVARARNTKYLAELRLRMKPYQNRISRNDPSMEAIAEKILTQVVARTILLGWENLRDQDNNPIEYSIEKCEEILGNPKFKDFRDLIETLSEDMSSYKEEVKQEMLGN